MKTFATLCCSISALVLALAGCDHTRPSAPDTYDADVKAITDIETEWSKATAANDADKSISYFADDAMMIISGEEPLRGKAAVGAIFYEIAKDPLFSLRFQTAKVDVARSGDLAYTWGSYQVTETDPATHQPMSDHGSYVTTYRKQADGVWKAELDIVVSNAPAPPPPSANVSHK
jgi:uncharacterized protein (TIGR02246 family)